MDLSRARIVLRQRSVLDVLDLALRFLVRHAGSYARVSAATLLPAALVSWGVARVAGWIWCWVATVFLALLVQTPFTFLAARLVFQPEVSVREVLGMSLRALPRVLGLRSVQVLAVGLGLMMFLLPGLWIGVALFFIVEVAVLERATFSTAISRSLRIAAGQSGQAVVAVLALGGLYLAAIALGDEVGRSTLMDLFQFNAPESLWTAGGSTLALLGFWLFVPYAATARFLVYLDLRTRSEGWDIQTRFAAIALRAAEMDRRAA
jgi:hypothetical protein